jgi:hypothetical protein
VKASFVPVQWTQPSDQGRRNKLPISIGDTQPFSNYRTAAIMQRHEDRNMRIQDGWELYCGEAVDRRWLGANGGKLTVPATARVSLYSAPYSHEKSRYPAVAAPHVVSRRGHTITAASRGMPDFASIQKASLRLAMGMWTLE